MATLAFEIRELLERHNGTFYSEHGVEISDEKDGSIRLVAPLPNYRAEDKAITLELVIGYSSMNDFIRDFAITHWGDIEDIKPIALWQRYEKGKAELFCSVDEWLKEYLYFRRMKGSLYVTNELDLQHTSPLITWTCTVWCLILVIIF